MALSGLGGDELFGGYSSFRRLRWLAWVAPLMRVTPVSGRRLLGRLLNSGLAWNGAEKLPDLLATDGTVPEAYPILRQVFDCETVDNLLGNAAMAEHRPYSQRLLQEFRDHPSTPLLARVSHAEMSCYMRDVLLRDTDQMSMNHSLEVRVPLLDRDLVEYALALPEAARRLTRPPKRWLVEAVGNLLPDELAERSKSGFALPFERWMRDSLEAFSRRGLATVADHAAFSPDAVRTVWRAFTRGDLSWSRPWLLVALGHWMARERIT